MAYVKFLCITLYVFVSNKILVHYNNRYDFLARLWLKSKDGFNTLGYIPVQGMEIEFFLFSTKLGHVNMSELEPATSWLKVYTLKTRPPFSINIRGNIIYVFLVLAH